MRIVVPNTDCQTSRLSALARAEEDGPLCGADSASREYEKKLINKNWTGMRSWWENMKIRGGFQFQVEAG